MWCDAGSCSPVAVMARVVRYVYVMYTLITACLISLCCSLARNATDQRLFAHLAAPLGQSKAQKEHIPLNLSTISLHEAGASWSATAL